MKVLKNKWVKGILFFFLWIFMFGISPKLWGVVNLLIGVYYFYNLLYKNEKFRTKNKIIKIVIGSFVIFFTLSFGAAGLTYDEKEMLAQKEQQEQQKLQKQQDEEQKKIEEQKRLEDEQKRIEEQKRVEEEAKKVKEEEAAKKAKEEEDKKKAEELAAASVSQVASNETTTVESSKQDNNVSNTPSSSSTTANSSSVPAQAENKSADKKVYWTPKGKSYHFRKSCSTLSNSKTINEGPLSSCPKSDPCDKCAL